MEGCVSGKSQNACTYSGGGLTCEESCVATYNAEGQACQNAGGTNCQAAANSKYEECLKNCSNESSSGSSGGGSQSVVLECHSTSCGSTARCEKSCSNGGSAWGNCPKVGTIPNGNSTTCLYSCGTVTCS